MRYGGLGAFLETKVLNQSLGIFSNFSAENPPHRKAVSRCASVNRRNRQMEDLNKLREEIEYLKFTTEDEFNTIRKQFEKTLEYINSQTEAASALNLMIQENIQFVKDVYEKFEIKNIEINNLKLNIQTLETLIRTQNIKIETLEFLQNIKK